MALAKKSRLSKLTKGTTIGNSLYRGESIPIKIKEIDRLRHIYMIGKTGGQDCPFENMILQDIKEGKGVCYLDPNGMRPNILTEYQRERMT